MKEATLKEKVTVITTGYLPVPATKGGAVENIVENIIFENEAGNLDLTVFSCYDVQAEKMSAEYRNTTVESIKIPKTIQSFDNIFYRIISFFKKENNLSFRYIFQRLYYIYSVACRLKKYDYGKIVIENHSSLLLCLKLFSNFKKYDKKIYYHVHNEIKSYYGCSNVFNSIKTIVGVSEYINGVVSKKLSKNNIDSHYEVLSNMIDTRKFRNELSDIDKEKLYQKYNLKPENKIVLFTGRLTPDKGILELLEAFNNLNLNNVILLIVGSYYFKSDTHSDFEKQFKDLANSSVRFTGFVEYEDIPKTYQLADIVVLPSIWEDPAPLTVIEALSAGVPLITTDSGGIPEYVKGTDTIVLTRDENLVNNITSSIRNLLNNEYKLSIMKNSSLSHTEGWSLEKYYQNFKTIILKD